MGATLRRVVTGHDDQGRPIVVSDGPPPHMFAVPDGVAAADLWSLAGPPSTAGDGYDPEPDGGFSIEPPVGGMWWRFVRLPPPDPGLDREEQFLEPHGGTSGGRRGMHATASLDFAVIIDGQIELETETDCTLLGPGDCVVQRGTQHRWRVVGDRPCSYVVALFSPVPGAAAVEAPLTLSLADPAAVGFGPRRIVVGPGAGGGSAIVADSAVPSALAFAGGGGIADLWLTGGALADVAQGGDAPGASWQLEPGAGIAWRYVRFAPGADPASGVVHTTSSIDLVVVLEGEIDLTLPGSQPVALAAGDLVVQRGTAHAWTNTGPQPAAILAIMIGVPVPE